MIDGGRDNQLVGYGIVVGLAGDGDSNAATTLRSVANILQRYGLTINPNDIKAKNAAAVMITADISAFLKPGSRIDVNVASMGDAKTLQGAVLQAVNHGISTPALFLLVGMIYERRHTREIAALKGLQRSAPVLAAVFTVVMLSSIGVPGLNGFAGEFLILLGSFLTARWWTVVAATGVILAALYLLWAYQRVFHGEPDGDNADVRDLKLSEGLVLAPLVGLIVFLGVYPKPVIDRIEPSVVALIEHVEAQTGEQIQPDVADEGYDVVADDVPEPRHGGEGAEGADEEGAHG